VFASSTYNAGIFPNMETLVNDLVAHNIMNRHVALIENGSWALSAGTKMKAALGKQKNITFVGETVSVKSSVKDEQLCSLSALADAIVETMPRPAPIGETAAIELKAMFDLSYGLYVLTAREGGRDNGCIVNTACQITDTPQRITVTVNKATLTHEMILKTGMFNVSVLSTAAPMGIFRRFGYQSGRDVDKFEGIEIRRSKNGLSYIPCDTNAYISAKVIQVVDVGTHSLFVADVEEAKVISNELSCTYDYYFRNIKPAPKPTAEKKTGWVCKICGYVYEGDPLPPDFICPICKHGAADFERLQ
jgi:flavin reductase (DIM6/NTAB) family NADH-FMN oxidoreductase RutF